MSAKFPRGGGGAGPFLARSLYAAGNRFYAADVAGGVGAKKYIFIVFLKGKC